MAYLHHQLLRVLLCSSVRYFLDVPELQDVVISQRFWHKDFENFLKSEFGNPDYVGHFVLDAQEQRNDTGIRVFEDPQDAGVLKGILLVGIDGKGCNKMLCVALIPLQIFGFTFKRF